MCHQGRFLKSLRKAFQDKLAHANSTAEESITNMVTVRSFSNELKMTEGYGKDIDVSYRLGRKIVFLSGGWTREGRGGEGRGGEGTSDTV